MTITLNGKIGLSEIHFNVTGVTEVASGVAEKASYDFDSETWEFDEINFYDANGNDKTLGNDVAHQLEVLLNEAMQADKDLMDLAYESSRDEMTYSDFDCYFQFATI